MLVYSYPVYSPQVVYSTPYVQSQHQQLRDFVEAAEAAATRQYLSQLEEQRARVELHRQVAIRQAEYQRREALAAQYAQSRRGLRTGYAPRRQVHVKQEGAPLVFVPTFEQERRVEDYLGTALAELLGLREDAEAGRIRAEQARIEQAKKDDAVRAARKAEALKEAFKAAAFEELRKVNEREEARRAAALEQARQLRAKQEAERVYAIHNALKAAAFAEAHQASLPIPERKAEPTEEAAHILSVRRALEVAALEQARKAQAAKIEEARKTQIEAAAKLEESRKAAEIKRRAAIKAKKIVDSDRMRKAAIENSRARFVAEIEALRKELENASNAAAGETLKPNYGTIPVEHETPAPEANESTESNVERLSRNRAARAIQRRWRSRSADRTAHKDALDTISTLRSRFEFLKSTFVAPEYLEFRDPTSISTSSDSDSDLPTLSFAPANAGVHSYTHELTKLMMLADGVSSAGSDSIRNARKDFVKMVEKALDEVDGIVKAVWEKMHPQEHEELVRVPIVEKNEIVEGEKPTEAKEEAAEELKIETAEPLNVEVKESESVVNVEPAVPVTETRAEDVAVVVESEPTPVSTTVAEVDTELTTQPSGGPVTSESAEEVKVEAAEPLNVKVKESESVVDAEPAVPAAEPRVGGAAVVESEPSSVSTTVAEVDTELSNQPSEDPVASESQPSVEAEPNVDPSASIAIEVEESQEGSVDVPVTLVLTEEQEEKPTSTPIIESSDTATISSEIEVEVSKDVEEEQAEVLEEPHVEKSLPQAAVLPSTDEPVIVEAAEEPTLSTIELEDLPSVPTEEPTSIASSTPINLDIDVPTPSSVSTASESDAEVDVSARSGSPAIDSFDMVYPDSPSSRPLQQPEAEVQVAARLEQTKANDDSSSVSSDTPSLEGFEML